MAFLIYASFSKVLSVSFDLYGHSFTEETDVNRTNNHKSANTTSPFAKDCFTSIILWLPLPLKRREISR